MFEKCSSLEKINLSSFNTSPTVNIREMFDECISLKKLNISNFNINNSTNINYLFYRCSPELKKEIHKQNPSIREEAFME